MKFPYRQYISQYPGTSDFRLILRPVITVRITGPRASARWDALVDTGADETLLPLSLGEVLGVVLDHDTTSQAAGITGELLTILYGDVEFQISDGHQVIRWRTTVGFVDFGSPDDEVIALGHGGCLDYFTARFDGENAELELAANSLLPY
jgi:predicted aspartyl protease